MAKKTKKESVLKREIMAAKNIAAALALNVVTVLVGFVYQRVFISTLGPEYLGLNSLLTSIINVFSMADLGMGVAVSFYLYKCLAGEAKKERIVELLGFYKKATQIISIAIIGIGIILGIFIKDIVGSTTISSNLYIIFAIFIANAVLSYSLIYRKIMLASDQRTYIINLVHSIYMVIVTVLQIVGLIVFSNYYLLIITALIGKLVENLILSALSKKYYPYTVGAAQHKLEKKVSRDIFRRMRASVFHSTASYIILLTDNLFIARLFNLLEVAIYSNYLMIINAINHTFSQVFSSLTATLGIHLNEKRKEDAFLVLKKLIFINQWVYIYATIGLFCVSRPFISLWVGEEFVFSDAVMIALCASFYIQGTAYAVASAKSAAGIVYEDRFAPIFDMALNIVASLVLGRLIGVAGVFIGTALSMLMLHIYRYPKYVYKLVYERKPNEYRMLYLKYAVVCAGIGAVTVAISRSVTNENNIVDLFIQIALCTILPNLLFFVLFRRTSEMAYVVRLVQGAFKTIRRSKK
jgi:O-antigen/teichoic acid export membrane protein